MRKAKPVLPPIFAPNPWPVIALRGAVECDLLRSNDPDPNVRKRHELALEYQRLLSVPKSVRPIVHTL